MATAAHIINCDSPTEDQRLLIEDSFNGTSIIIPVDRCHLVYIIFYLLGVAALLPWNFFINAKQYFMYKLRNVTWDNSTTSWTNESLFNENQIMFENYVELAALLPSVVFMFINMAATKVVTVRLRIGVAMLVVISLFTLTISLTCINTDPWQNQFLVISLVSVIFMNAGSSVLQGSLCGLASLLPRKYMQAVMSGMAVGGVAAAVANIITISLASTTPLLCGFAYFLIAEVVSILSLIAFMLLYRMDFVKYYLSERTRSRTIEKSLSKNLNTGLEESSMCSVDSLTPAVLVNNSASHICHILLTIFKQIWIEGLCILVLFFVSLSCYPALSSAIQSTTLHNTSQPSIWASLYFVPVFCFLVFNLTDFIGRCVGGCVRWSTSLTYRVLLLALCTLRILFIPLFLFSNIQPRAHLPVLLNNDYLPFITMAMFGLSNGYLATVAMTNGPKHVADSDSETAGCMMGFCMSIGLALGALLSMLLRHSV